MLLRWKGRSAEAIMSAIHAETTCRVTAGDVDAFLQFLHNNHLMRDPPQEDIEPISPKPKRPNHSG